MSVRDHVSTSEQRLPAACGLARGGKSRSRRAKPQAANAFTLIEVLVTMLLLSILVPVIAEGLSVSLAAASSAQHKTEAAGLAQDELNQLISTGDWSSVTSGDFGSDHPGYRWACQNSAGNNGVSQVQLNVTWTERNQPRQFTLSTMVNTNTTDTTSSTTTTGGLP